MVIRTIKITQDPLGGDAWRVQTENREIDEVISPDTLIWEIDQINGSRVYLRDWVGSRPSLYLRAERSIEGWHKFKRYTGKKLYW